LAGLQQRRSRDAALPVIDRLVREYPKSSEAAEALGMKGRLLEGAVRYADAAAVYVKLVSDQPDHEEAAIALWRLGWLAWFRGSYAEAAQQWERLAVAKVGQSHREAVTYWIARTHEQRGQMET